MNYDELREACLELYLQVKIRSDEEIECYDEQVFKREKEELKASSGFDIIEMVKACIEQLMNLNDSEAQEGYGGEERSQRHIPKQVQSHRAMPGEKLVAGVVEVG